MDNREAWIGGLILILIGVAFMLRNLGILDWQLFDNWWALFIAIPGLAALVNAWRSYQRQGRFTGEVAGSFIGSLMLLGIALIFLFELDWSQIWPIFLILGGLSILLRGRLSFDE